MHGKIARLPRSLREQLNCRLEAREPHKSLLNWLNSLAEVKAILVAQFDAQPITKQNLYDIRTLVPEVAAFLPPDPAEDSDEPIDPAVLI